jgi:hypothetical protein
VSSDDLTFLQDWYARHCDGDWEHDSRVRISTLDNPGWRLWVNLEDTELAGRHMPRTSGTSSDEQWIDYQCDGIVFDAACGLRGLGPALAAFRELAGSDC